MFYFNTRLVTILLLNGIWHKSISVGPRNTDITIGLRLNDKLWVPSLCSLSEISLIVYYQKFHVAGSNVITRIEFTYLNYDQG